MTRENRETMQRAIGVIEGVAYGASVRVTDALGLAVELLDTILDSEEKEEHDSNIVRVTKRKQIEGE